jgi:hypothetical protein
MAENYFGDDADSGAGPASSSSDPESDSSEQKEQGDKPMSLINSEIMPGLKPGDTMELKIVAVHEHEYQVEAMEKENESDEQDQDAGQEGGMQAPAEGSMASMMS